MEALRALLVPALLPELCFEAMRERPLHGAGMGNGDRIRKCKPPNY